jgi:hypothetical protein
MRDIKSPLLLYNQNRKVKFYPNSYPSSQNDLISKEIITARLISLKLKIAGEIVFIIRIKYDHHIILYS